MKKIRIGILGQSGFIGTNLYNYLGLYPNDFIRIPFYREYFNDIEKLSTFISRCDAIVHLSALNRHNNPQIIYKTNINLVKILIRALDASDKVPHIIYVSSIHEDKDNLYGKSKKDGRIMLDNWSKKRGCTYTGFVFPNVFGPFGSTYYNSFIATFSYQLTHNEEPIIDIDREVPLIYIDHIAKILIQDIQEKFGSKGLIVSKQFIDSQTLIKVSDVLNELIYFKQSYYDNGILPSLSTEFDVSLFNTFRSYIDYENHFPISLNMFSDDRGSFVETVKAETGGQFSFSSTKPNIIRGNHFHTRKIERFIVIKGKAQVQMRKIGSHETLTFNLSGSKPGYVDIPIWYTHNLKNLDRDILFSLFWINEPYNPDDPDTFFEEV